MRRLNLDTDPVDTYGEAGDIVFWHHVRWLRLSRCA